MELEMMPSKCDGCGFLVDYVEQKSLRDDEGNVIGSGWFCIFCLQKDYEAQVRDETTPPPVADFLTENINEKDVI